MILITELVISTIVLLLRKQTCPKMYKYIGSIVEIYWCMQRLVMNIFQITRKLKMIGFDKLCLTNYTFINIKANL